MSGCRSVSVLPVRDTFQPVVYILASGKRGTLYIGCTSNLAQRLHQHREGLIPGFTRRYGVTRLVWFEMHEAMATAIVRERQLKEWRRGWKVELIEQLNFHWDDLAVGLGIVPAEPQHGSRLPSG